jgi:hypothetical protein
LTSVDIRHLAASGLLLLLLLMLVCRGDAEGGEYNVEGALGTAAVLLQVRIDVLCGGGGLEEGEATGGERGARGGRR